MVRKRTKIKMIKLVSKFYYLYCARNEPEIVVLITAPGVWGADIPCDLKEASIRRAE